MDAEDGRWSPPWCRHRRFDANCLPTHLIHAGKHHRQTNVAFRGKTLYITDSIAAKSSRRICGGGKKNVFGVK
jgi:hypothetical protein